MFYVKAVTGQLKKNKYGLFGRTVGSKSLLTNKNVAAWFGFAKLHLKKLQDKECALNR